MLTLTPYLSFEGNCAEAMAFYKDCFGGELDIQKVGDSPMAAQMPDKKDWVMHAMLKADGIVIMASDLMQGVALNRGNSVTLTLWGGTKADLETVFTKLQVGGTVTHALEEAFFGTYGDLTDKFGVLWAFQADPAPKTA